MRRAEGEPINAAGSLLGTLMPGAGSPAARARAGRDARARDL